ncbi:hypothetical protein RB195_005318 [Necator americanus]|uniref:Uncharacterized protein n=1 Tax=Necator americanus TaxID=51031 RepID=A0ABR1BQG7_NECAM
MRATCLCFVFISLPTAVFAISCLVTRPGYGFASEACPAAAVGCRIKARSDHVEWYEWSKLYDRNQLVCVYPGEYEGIAGCVRKHSGNVRCWCGGTDDCNSPETSRQLLDAFQKSDKKKMQVIIRKLEMGANLGEEVEAETTTGEPTTTSTTAITTRTKPTRPPTKKHTQKKYMQKGTKPVSRTTTTVTASTTTPSTTTKKWTATTKAISNNIESDDEALPLPTEAELGDTFDETRRRLNEEMREEDERLQQLLADEEAEMSRDQEDTAEEREEQRRKERERNRMERRERARADERRRLTEEETLRKHEKAQKHREVLPSSEEIDDDYENAESSANLTSISLISSIFSLLMLLIR